MVLNDSVSAIVEAVYLSESLTGQTGKANIQVNPSESITYLVGKTIIISDPNYPEKKVKSLVENGNHVLLRVPIGNYPVTPYILRVDFGVMWNGQVIDDIEELEESILVILNKYQQPELYFPKIKGYKGDSEHLSWLGWALHQVGQNIKEGTRFKDLDLLKLKKARL